MTIAVLSGKGGTGKTTVSTNLAFISSESILVDCDVEEPNSGIFLDPVITTTEEIPIRYPEIDNVRCTNCGECARFCRFNAIISSPKKTIVQPQLCHDCGACKLICPAQAIRYISRPLGTLSAGTGKKQTSSQSAAGPNFYSGLLTAGEHSGVRIIHRLRELTAGYAGHVIIDSPPGTACSTVAAVEGADLALIVTEPTPFGLSDMKMVVELLRNLAIPMYAVVNKAGLGDRDVYQYCREEGIPIVAEIPFDRQIAACYARGGLIAEMYPRYSRMFSALYSALTDAKDSNGKQIRTVEPAPPRELVVISGKGGTGKTMISASLIPFLDNPVIADCDVDAPDLHILLDPVLRETTEFIGMQRAIIDDRICVKCRLCRNNCEFDAIEVYPSTAGEPGEVSLRINPLKCEGCGVCEYICPENAVRMEDVVAGMVYESDTIYGPMVHARLNPGEETSGRLVSEVRTRAVGTAVREGRSFVLIDGSPGVGCNVISSITGADKVLVVTEPTMSGLHDLKRVLDVADALTSTKLVIINKADISAEMSQSIRVECERRGILIIAEIPFEKAIVAAITEKQIPSLSASGYFSSGEWQRVAATLME